MDKSDIFISILYGLLYNKSKKAVFKMNEPIVDIKNDIAHALTFYASRLFTSDTCEVLTTGHEKCEKDKEKIGPLKYNYTIIHYVFNGYGYLEYYINNEKKIQRIGPDTLFIILSNNEYTYYPDKEDPWEYSWISFYEKSMNTYETKLSKKDSPIIELKSHESVKKCFKEIEELNRYEYSKKTKAMGLMYSMFAEILENKIDSPEPEKSKNYITLCLSYIEENYLSSTISVKEIAKKLMIDEKYLSRLFSMYIKMPVYKYISMLKMKKAYSLLTTTSLNIKAISLEVGYDDPLYFSRKIKSYFGKTPTEIRLENNEKA